MQRDEEFWRNNIEPKATKFYHNCLLPEIVDPRKSRSVPLRNLNFEGDIVQPKTKRKERSQTRGRYR